MVHLVAVTYRGGQDFLLVEICPVNQCDQTYRYYWLKINRQTLWLANDGAGNDKIRPSIKGHAAERPKNY